CATCLESECPQDLQGSSREAEGREASGRGGLGAGCGFFQPEHLQEASALQDE
ncbi:Histone acetyltransferase KAT2Alike, partial [Caligus rogercresseyi]